jgi:hypothetical protein
VPISTRWLEQPDLDYDTKRRLLDHYKDKNPIMICSRCRTCQRYGSKLARFRMGRDPEITDNHYGVDKCNLYYGVGFAHLNKTRQQAALNRHKLSCFRGGKFYVHKAVIDNED